MPPVFLFDIDLTLMRTNGAGSAAMSQTLHELAGVADGFAGVTFAGRTDRSLLREALMRCGRGDDGFDDFCVAFEDRYFEHLQRELQARGAELLPGVVETLDQVALLGDVKVGLATGNFRRAAQLKLNYFGLWERFAGGGFAEDGEDRADLVAAGIARVAGDRSAGPVFVIGDSAYDISAALANGAIAVGVATGRADEQALRVAGAHVVLPSLAGPVSWLAEVLALA